MTQFKQDSFYTSRYYKSDLGMEVLAITYSDLKRIKMKVLWWNIGAQTAFPIRSQKIEIPTSCIKNHKKINHPLSD